MKPTANYQIKITLKFTSKPIVWRRIIIPNNTTFSELHLYIQAAMGWSNSHLYEFRENLYGSSIHIEVPNEDPFFSACTHDSRKTYINEFFTKEKDKMFYEYDFGDGWIHEIVLEKILDYTEVKSVCTAGRGACPPEDCGGPGGYEMIKSIFEKDPNGEKANNYRMWLDIPEGLAFDPHEFDIEMANEDIMDKDVLDWDYDD